MKKIAPRDIFNEANFVKGIAQCLKQLKNGGNPALRLFFDDSPKSLMSLFSICPDDGGLIANIQTIHKDTYQRFEMKRSMNSRQPYPLYLVCEDDSCHTLLDNNGDWDSESLDLFNDSNSESLNNTPDFENLFDYSLFLKNVGKFALLAIDNTLPGISFDESAYSDIGHIPFYQQDGYFYIDNTDHPLIDVDDIFGVELRYPDESSSNLWALEIRMEDNEYYPVFDINGDVQPYIEDQSTRQEMDFSTNHIKTEKLNHFEDQNLKNTELPSLSVKLR